MTDRSRAPAGTGGDEPNAQSQAAASGGFGQGPGARVKAAREAAGLSREYVADQLHLLVRVVRDLEEENWDKLPPATFTRGYYRAYAKLLGIDIDAVYAAYDATAPRMRGEEVAPAVRPAGPVAARVIRANPGTAVAFALAAGLAIVLLLLWLLWPSGGSDVAQTPPLLDVPAEGTRTLAPGPARQAGPTPEQGTGESVRPAGRSLEALLGGVDADIDAAARAAWARLDALTLPLEPAVGPPPQEGSPDVPRVAALEGRAQDGADEPPSVRRITPQGEDRLELGFSDDCWVDVRGMDGENLYSDLHRAGDELHLIGEGPFRILIGYAPGVRLTYNGEPVELRGRARNNVASVTLGR